MRVSNPWFNTSLWTGPKKNFKDPACGGTETGYFHRPSLMGRRQRETGSDAGESELEKS